MADTSDGEDAANRPVGAMRVRLRMSVWIGGARAYGRGRPRAEDGFSLVEAITGLTLIFGAMMIILLSLNTGVRGLLTGRERQTATTVAKEQMEKVRQACYERIGHDYGDTTLGSDTASLRSSGGVWYYEPQGPGGFSEKLAQATTSAGCTGSAVVGTHTWSSNSDGTPYTVWVYVTRVDPTVANTGVRHKRVTVVVQWDNSQYKTGGIDNRVRLSSLVFDGQPPGGTSGGGGGTSQFPITTATAQPVAGSFGWSGSLSLTGGGPLAAFGPSTVTYPQSNGWMRTFLRDETNGTAKSHSFTFSDTNGGVATPAGCTTAGSTITCPPAQNSATADNDGGTSPTPPAYDAPAISTAPSRTITKPGGLYSLTVGSGSADSKATACANTCGLPFGSPPESDGLPHDLHVGNGPDPYSMNFNLGNGVSGELIESGPANARAEIDQDTGIPNRRTTAKAKNTYPQTKLLQLLNTDVLGFGTTLSVVSIDAFNVEVAADIGTPASGATCTPGPAPGTFNITVLTATGLSIVPITPCTTQMNQTYGRTFSVVDVLGQPVASVQTTATIVTNSYTETEVTEPGGFKKADGKLLEWLTITTTMRITYQGNTVADVTSTLKYGDLTAFAERVP